MRMMLLYHAATSMSITPIRAVRVSRCQLITFQLEDNILVLSQQPVPLRVVNAVKFVRCFGNVFPSLV